MSMIMILESVDEDQKADNSPQPSPGETSNKPFKLSIWQPDSDVDDGDEEESSFDDEGDCVAVSEHSISLEKAWHGLHYLLNGEPWSGTGYRGFLVEGGREEGDTGYGPMRVFSPAEVRSIEAELSGVEITELWEDFDAQRFQSAGIYPDIWDEEADELFEEYEDYFETMKAFVSEVAEAGKALRISLG